MVLELGGGQVGVCVGEGDIRGGSVGDGNEGDVRGCGVGGGNEGNGSGGGVGGYARVVVLVVVVVEEM